MFGGVTVIVEEACRVLLSWMICIAQEVQIIRIYFFNIFDLILSKQKSVDVEFSSCAL